MRRPGGAACQEESPEVPKARPEAQRGDPGGRISYEVLRETRDKQQFPFTKARVSSLVRCTKLLLITNYHYLLTNRYFRRKRTAIVVIIATYD